MHNMADRTKCLYTAAKIDDHDGYYMYGPVTFDQTVYYTVRGGSRG